MNIKNFKLFHEISAGGILFKKERGVIKVLLIHRNQMNDWTLPKGHQEQGESLQETAIREVKEETGISALPQKYIGKFTYKVVDKKKKFIYFRTVYWFLMIYQSGKVRKKKDREILQVVWEPLNKRMLRLMTYQNDRKILQRAEKLFMRI